jgi:hypothetical protein
VSRTTRVLAVGLVAAVAMSQGNAWSAPKKKPITKKWTATAATPDPSNASPDSPYTVCPQVVPGSYHAETFKAPAAGKLIVSITGFQGDWDLLVVDEKKREVGSSGNGGYGTPASPSTEKITLKVKKAGTFSIVSCNWAGTPMAEGTYTFTYA